MSSIFYLSPIFYVLSCDTFKEKISIATRRFGKYRRKNAMQPLTSDEGKIKQLMKEALVEALQEQKKPFS